MWLVILIALIRGEDEGKRARRNGCVMKVKLSLDANHQIECQWSLWSGMERYLLNGREVYRVRSFEFSGARTFRIETDGQTKTITIKVFFRPSFKTLIRSNGFVAEVYVDNVLLVSDLLDKAYRHVPRITRALSTSVSILASIIVLIIIDANFFEGTILGLNVYPLPRSVKIMNAALATPECRGTLVDFDSSLLMSERKSTSLRAREMNRDMNWVIDNNRTTLSIITSIYEDQRPFCKKSILELLDRYLINGADINGRFGFRNQTVLESAIMAGDVDLVCELLKRGASVQEKVVARTGDGSNSAVTGMTLVELAKYQFSVNPTNKHEQVVDMVNNFLLEGKCNVETKP